MQAQTIDEAKRFESLVYHACKTRRFRAEPAR